jgi:hypothetical protein
MAQATKRERSRGRLSLSVRLSLLILFAALVPLAAVVSYNDYAARGTLIKQAQTGLTTDASSKVSQIDLYLNERLQDGAALISLPTTPAYLACVDAQGLPPDQAAAVMAAAHCNDQQLGMLFDAGSNCRALNVGIKRDPNYLVWGLFDGRGHPLLSATTSSSPADNCPADRLTAVPKEDLAPVLQQGKQWISAVYYDPQAKHAFVQVYTPVLDPSGSKQVLGFLRATLSLDYMWSIVHGEKDANGSGSAAFITDENGVRIASSTSSDLFTAVRPLTATAQQQISGEQRFGANFTVTNANLPEVQSSLGASTSQDTFQGIGADGSAKYQYVRLNLVNNQLPSQLGQLKAEGLNWSYFVLSPLSTVTAVSDNQVRTSLISAAVIAIVAVLIGLLVGRGTTRPVRASVTELEGAAASLKALASRQQSSAGEQHWVVDACKTGLESVRYLSDAMNQATRRIIDASNWFGEYWDRLTEDQARRTVAHLQELAQYIDEAARRQQASSERLDKAITVTMQVSDQLVAGANAATESADQLEQVVNDLQHVVGGKHAGDTTAEEDAERHDQMALVPVRQDLPPAAVPRQMPAPVRQPAQVRAGRGAPSGWGGQGDPNMNPGMSQAGWGDYPQYPQAPQAPYGPFGGDNGGGSRGGSRGGYNGDQRSQWGNMPPDGRSRGSW